MIDTDLGLAVAEAQDLLRQGACASRDAFDLPEPVQGRVSGVDVFARQRDVAQDGADDVVEVVGNAAGQRAQRFKPLGIVQLCLQGAQGGFCHALGRYVARHTAVTGKAA